MNDHSGQRGCGGEPGQQAETFIPREAIKGAGRVQLAGGLGPPEKPPVDTASLPAPRYMLYLAVVIFLSVLGTLWLDPLIQTASPGSGERSLLVYTRALCLMAFITCAFELMLNLLQWFGVPAMTLRQVRRAFGKTRSKSSAAGGGSSGSWWDGLKSLVLQPQFLLTVIIGTGTAATHVVVDAGSGPGLAPVLSRLDALDQRVGQLQRPIRATAQRVNDLTTSVGEIRVNLPDKKVGADTLAKVNSLDGAMGELKNRVGKISRSDSGLIREMRDVSASVGKIEGLATATEGYVTTNGFILGGLALSVDQVNTSMKSVRELDSGIARVLGTGIPRHPWDGSRDVPTVSSEIYRLVQHEDTLDKRISRLVGHDELRRVLEGPLQANEQKIERAASGGGVLIGQSSASVQ